MPRRPTPTASTHAALGKPLYRVLRGIVLTHLSPSLDVQPSFLLKLWVYCAARAKVQHVIGQLQTAGIQHRQESLSQTCEVPALYVNTEQMIPQADPALFHPILKISCIWKETRNIQVRRFGLEHLLSCVDRRSAQLLLRLKVNGMPILGTITNHSSNLDQPVDLRYDPHNQVVVLRCDEFSVIQVARLRAAAATLQLASQGKPCHALLDFVCAKV